MQRRREGSEIDGEIDTIICYRMRIFFSSLRESPFSTFLLFLTAFQLLFRSSDHHGVMLLLLLSCIPFSPPRSRCFTQKPVHMAGGWSSSM